MNIATDHPTLIVVRGIPGSGKSYIATELQRKIGDDKIVLLDPDAIDCESDAYQVHCRSLAAEGVDPLLFAYRFLRGQAYDAIEQHKVIVWNQPFTNVDIFRKMIQRLNDHAAEHNTALTILVVEVSIDPVVARRRVEQRKRDGGHGPSEQTLNKRFQDYQSFAGQGFRIISVHGEQDVNVSVETVLAAM